MVRNYTASDTTRRNLGSLKDVLGSYAETARFLNQSSRGRNISPQQVKRVIEGDNTRLSPAQQRRLRRNTSITASSGTKRTFKLKVAAKVRNVEENNRNSAKRAQLVRAAENSERIGDVAGAIGYRNRVAAMDDTVERIKNAAINAETADDYGDLSDISTP